MLQYTLFWDRVADIDVHSKLTLPIFEISFKSEEILNFYGIFVVFNALFIRITMFWFEKLCSLLVVGDVLEQKSLGITHWESLVDNITPQYQMIFKYFCIQYPHSQTMYPLIIIR